MIHIAICDDEGYMVGELERRVWDCFEKEGILVQIHCFRSGKDLLTYTERLDIIFLDIMMDGPDGLETARKLRNRDFQGFLIFVTVLEELVFESFEVQAFDYLLKPVREERFERVMGRLLRSLRDTSDTSLFVVKGNECSVILLDEIVYCEVIGRKVYLHLQNGKVLDYYEKMEHLSGRLDGRFCQCHRSYLINLKYLRSYKAGRAYLNNGESVPVSRLRHDGFNEAMLRYMKEREELGKWKS